MISCTPSSQCDLRQEAGRGGPTTTVWAGRQAGSHCNTIPAAGPDLHRNAHARAHAQAGVHVCLHTCVHIHMCTRAHVASAVTKLEWMTHMVSTKAENESNDSEKGRPAIQAYTTARGMANCAQRGGAHCIAMA